MTAGRGQTINNHENTIQNTGNPALDSYNIIPYFWSADSSYNFSCDIPFHGKIKRTFLWYIPQGIGVFVCCSTKACKERRVI